MCGGLREIRTLSLRILSPLRLPISPQAHNLVGGVGFEPTKLKFHSIVPRIRICGKVHRNVPLRGHRVRLLQ